LELGDRAAAGDEDHGAVTHRRHSLNPKQMLAPGAWRSALAFAAYNGRTRRRPCESSRKKIGPDSGQEMKRGDDQEEGVSNWCMSEVFRYPSLHQNIHQISGINQSIRQSVEMAWQAEPWCKLLYWSLFACAQGAPRSSTCVDWEGSE
jgi:hypothetical protein